MIKFADYIGDSLKLSRAAASRTEAEFIVFCGVHFMAESADILRAPHQKVVLPDLAAGCSMADMAAPDQLEMCWRELEQMGVRTDAVENGNGRGHPGHLHQFVGGHQSVRRRARRHRLHLDQRRGVMKWAWERGEKLLMLPDQHLGRNTAYKMGVPLDEMVVWDPNEMWGGLTADAGRSAKLILWKGHCSVHTRFTVAQIEAFRKKHPGGKRHRAPRVHARRRAGRRRQRLDRIHHQHREEQPARGSVWAVATEIHLVNRLANEVAPDKTVVTLDPFGCLCSTMFRVSPNHLLWVLEGLVEGQVHNQITVPDDIKHDAKLALDRMLSTSTLPAIS